ncbi:MAG: 3-phosphoshikimate 1-carboxyvinyltransferase [Deltaproteobacteria bacterium]|nr:3-phosphoshikimate 1-carboxyvinyltransferase [Deltaproteobacteria bacterium]
MGKLKETYSKEVFASGPLMGEITVPGDKSISHRAVMLGSIADGVTEVSGFLPGEDTLSTLNVFRSMGVDVGRPSIDRLVIKGVGLNGLKEPPDVIDARNSGTTARLIAGLLCAQPFFSVITGDDSLRKRPMKRVALPLRLMGAVIEGRNNGSFLPIAISGRPLKGIEYTTPVPSAQVKSAILLAGLYADGETAVIEPQVSRDHTERMLKLFGADVKTKGTNVMIKKARALRAVDIKVPGDISSAAFFMVAASCVEGSDLLIKGVGVNPTRCGIIEILKRMGADITVSEVTHPADGYPGAVEPVADIRIRASRLKGIAIGETELLPAIDEFPIICVAAAMAVGRTVITGAGELRVKESDRINVVAGSLSSLGVEVLERPDGMEIEGKGANSLFKRTVVNSHGDHRIAMSMAVAGLCSEGITIEDSSAVDVSFPKFFEFLEGLSRVKGT